jgi:hypothetical protein
MHAHIHEEHITQSLHIISQLWMLVFCCCLQLLIALGLRGDTIRAKITALHTALHDKSQLQNQWHLFQYECSVYSV